MKEIWAVIRRNKFAQTKKALDDIGYGAMSIHSVWGRGKQGGFAMSETEAEMPSYATAAPNLVPTSSKYATEGATITKPLVYMPKRMIVMVVPDEAVDKIVDTIISVNRTGSAGDGKIFIMPVEESITIRTGEKTL